MFKYGSKVISKSVDFTYYCDISMQKEMTVKATVCDHIILLYDSLLYVTT